MSGKFNIYMLSLGLLSSLIVVLISNRMDAIDRETYPARLTLLLLRFWVFLVREIIIANYDVVRRIFMPGKNISPQFFKLPISLDTDVSRVTYANVITLTPGTVSVTLNKDSITVHSLTREAMHDLCSGRIASHVPEDEQDDHQDNHRDDHQDGHQEKQA